MRRYSSDFRSINVPLRDGPIQMAYLSRPDECRVDQPRVYAHTVRQWIDRQPMRHTSTLAAAVELNRSIVPDVNVSSRCSQEFHLGWLIVGPKYAIPPTYRAVAVGDLRRRNIDFEPNRRAVAGSLYHAVSVKDPHRQRLARAPFHRVMVGRVEIGAACPSAPTRAATISASS